MKRWTRSVVALGLTLFLQTASSARADRIYTDINVGDPYRGGITIRTSPDMTLIPNSDVYVVRDADYDLYRYQGWYYLVDNDAWYRARSWHGPFTYVRMATIPRAVVTVPERYRRTWTSTITTSPPTGQYTRTETRYARPGVRYRGVVVRYQPRMALIPRTRVYYVRGNYDNDLYRYGSRWYFVDGGTWYASDSWRGPFFSIRWRDVPVSVRHLPARYRRNWSYAGMSDRDEDVDNRATVVRIGERTDFVLDMVPHMAIIPGTSVYYSRDDADYDIYRYGDSWYLAENGYWYRASSWRGPFLRVRPGSVPHAVYAIPAGYRKTWVPSMD